MNADGAMFYVVSFMFYIVFADILALIDIAFKYMLSIINADIDGYVVLAALYVALNVPNAFGINVMLQLMSYIASSLQVEGLIKFCPSERTLLEMASAVNCSNSYNA